MTISHFSLKHHLVDKLHQLGQHQLGQVIHRQQHKVVGPFTSPVLFAYDVVNLAVNVAVFVAETWLPPTHTTPLYNPRELWGCRE